MWAEGYAGYVIAAFSLDELQSSGTELSQVGEGFIDYVGTTSVTGTPDPMGMVFLIGIAIMYMAIIWVPKKD